MQDIAIFGASGMGREVACVIRMINEADYGWNLIGFFDDNPSAQSEFGELLGGMDALNKWDKPLALAIGLGYSAVRRKVAMSITNPLISFPNLISPDCFFYHREGVRMGKGNIVGGRNFISINQQWGDFNLINYQAALGHDLVMGNFNSIMPGVSISGCCTLGNTNFIGVNATILQGLQIGNNVMIGAQATLTTHTEDNNTYVGTPARKLTK